MEMLVSVARLVRISSYNNDDMRNYSWISFDELRFPCCYRLMHKVVVVTFKVLMCVASVDLT